MNKKNNFSNKKFISLIKVGGIRALITTDGILETSKKIPISTRKKIEETIKDGLENILEGWILDGEYKDNSFYIKNIKNNNGKILDFHETIEWANIIGYKTFKIDKNDLFKNVLNRDNIRPESSYDVSEYKDLTSGSMRSSWKRKVVEKLNEKNVL